MAINANATAVNANWNADDVALNYIYPTLDNVSVLIKGVTINEQVSVEVGGGNAFLYKEGDVTVTEGAAGRKFSGADADNYRIDIPLNKSFQVDEFIPDAAIEAIGVEVVAPYLIKATNAIANAWGKKGLAVMLAGGTPLGATATPATASTAYATVVDAITSFDGKTANAKRVEGANYLIVTPAYLGLLRKSPEFLATQTPAGRVITDGIIGSVAGLTVVLSKQLGSFSFTNNNAVVDGYKTITGLEFIIGSHDAFAAPVIFRKYRVIDTELAFGVRVQAEIPYGFKVIEPDRIVWRANVATVE